MPVKNITTIGVLDWKRLLSFVCLVFCFASATYGQCSMSCDDEIQVSLNQNCEAEITYRMILRDPDNSDICSPNGPSAYKVVVMDEAGVEIPSSPIITCEYTGRTLLVKVKHWYSGNSCWSKVVVEDKNAPILACTPVTLFCTQNIAPTSEGGDAPVPSMMDGCASVCQSLSLSYVDTDTTYFSCGDGTVEDGVITQINRTWTACDNLDNCRTCVQLISLKIPSFLDINFPTDLVGASALSCGGCDPTDLACTGKPILQGEGLNNALCNITYDFIDVSTNTECEGTRTISRAWAIQNTCTGETHNYTQLIEIVDQTPPIINCANGNTAVVATPNLTPYSCLTTLSIPAAEVTDNCSSVAAIEVVTKVYRIDSLGRRFVVERVDGANGGFDLDVEYGIYEVYYQATDDCGNVSNNLDNACRIEVNDEVPPTPICKTLTKLTLDSEGFGKIYAESFDDGSYDNCCLESFQVRRLGDASSELMDYVTFSCEDAQSGSVMVLLEITDCHGNTANCTVEVIIENNIIPTITGCADNITLSCATAPSLEEIRTTLLSPPTFENDCASGVTTNAVMKQDYRNECGIGAVIFDWQILDAAGTITATCEQLVSFVDATPLAITFPEDFVIATCLTSLDELSTARTGTPTITGMDCEVVEVLFTDATIGSAPSCMTVQRTWTVTNLCEENGTLEHVQTISIQDVEAPILECNGEFFDICLDGGACTKSFVVEGVTVSDCSSEVSVRAEWTFSPHDACTGTVQTGTVMPAQFGFVTPELGPGTLWVNFYATDACGNESRCNRDYTIKDCEAPEVLCLPGITLNLDATGTVEVWANDFHQELTDNCEDCEGFEYTFSFTQDMIEDVRFYDCDDLGVKTAQVWVMDAYGNQNFCPVTFVIKGAAMCENLGQDTSSVDAPLTMAAVAGQIYLEDGEAVEGVAVSAENHLSEMMDMYMTDGGGAYAFEFQRSTNLLINPAKNDDILNGVTTYDILQLRKHILGREALDSPYKMIAADINHNNSITTADIVALRRVILQYEDTFKHNTSWRFIKADHEFSDVTNPFVDEMPEYAAIPDLRQELNIDFVAIKVGDLNGTATGNKAAGARSTKKVNFEIAEQSLSPNQIETLTFTIDNATIQALQLTLNFDPSLVNIIDFPKTSQVTEANFGTRFLERGALTMSWDAPTNTNEFFSFKLKVKAKSQTAVSELFTINSLITPAEAYDGQGTTHQVGLTTLDAIKDYALWQNQPNPFQKATTIRFSLPAQSQGKLTILDFTGRTLKTIQQHFRKGVNELIISDLTQNGVLYYRLETDFGTQTKKMLKMD